MGMGLVANSERSARRVSGSEKTGFEQFALTDVRMENSPQGLKPR